MRLPSRQVAGLSVCAVRVSFFACMSAVECDLTALFSVSVFPGLSRSFPVFPGLSRSFSGFFGLFRLRLKKRSERISRIYNGTSAWSIANSTTKPRLKRGNPTQRPCTSQSSCQRLFRCRLQLIRSEPIYRGRRSVLGRPGKILRRVQRTRNKLVPNLDDGSGFRLVVPGCSLVPRHLCVDTGLKAFDFRQEALPEHIILIINRTHRRLAMMGAMHMWLRKSHPRDSNEDRAKQNISGFNDDTLSLLMQFAWP